MAKDIDRTKRLKWDSQKIIRLVTALAFSALVVYVVTVSLFIVREWNIFSIFIYFVLLFSVFGQISFPFLSYVRAYPVYLLASIFGLWMSILFWLNRFGAIQHPLSFSIALIVSLGVLYPIHLVTRKGFLLYRKFQGILIHLDLQTITRIGTPVVAPLLILANVVFSGPVVLERNLSNALTLVCFLLLLYVCFSMASLNVAYRGKLLSGKFKTRDYRTKLHEILRELVERHKDNTEQAEFFSYLVRSAANDFVYGSYERSFLDDYRVINDEILIKPEKIWAIFGDKLDKKKAKELRRVRVHLVHGMFEERPGGPRTAITTEDVLKTRKQIFAKSLEIVELAFYLSERI